MRRRWCGRGDSGRVPSDRVERFSEFRVVCIIDIGCGCNSYADCQSSWLLNENEAYLRRRFDDVV